MPNAPRRSRLELAGRFGRRGRSFTGIRGKTPCDARVGAWRWLLRLAWRAAGAVDGKGRLAVLGEHDGYSSRAGRIRLGWKPHGTRRGKYQNPAGEGEPAGEGTEGQSNGSINSMGTSSGTPFDLPMIDSMSHTR